MIELKVSTPKYKLFPALRKTYICSVPETFAECKPDQFRLVMNTIAGFAVDDDKFITHLTTLPLAVVRKLGRYQKYKIIEHLLELQKHFKADRHFYIKTLKLERVFLDAPADGIKNMPFQQFMFADSWYSSWLNTDNDPQLLARTVAFLYLNRKFDADRCMSIAGILEKFYQPTLMAIAYNFAMVKMWLSEEYPNLFFTAPEEEAPAQKKKKTDSTGTDWVTIFDNLRGDDLANTDKYAEMPATEVFRYLEKAIVKKQQKKLRGK